MNAFEQLTASLLFRDGYWVYPNFKVELTKDEKRQICLPTTPRWEIDLLAYKPRENKLLCVECKSYLDSSGVSIKAFQNEQISQFKLFVRQKLREVVLARLVVQLTSMGLVADDVKPKMALAAGKIASGEHAALQAHFLKNDWLLFDGAWIRAHLRKSSSESYDNTVASVVAKILLRDRDA